ncbi:hypothetical protein N7462_003001 [Penicillium macrosclerotiorum]|uniref:uncharacterized protein n=1 Tax=Penicillium macrosclerotiorum TaxID=303699 RepID=UPI0025495287|nr:uncharacterized protein N7462_003001 [Penicillium macrosclerotiorum]KAJ5688609.1 hypothetical protein N7462_003001 [Penicillium macrosclerotiorum]
MSQEQATAFKNQSIEPDTIKVFQNVDEIHKRWLYQTSSFLGEISQPTDAQIFTLNVSEVIERRIRKCNSNKRTKLVFMCLLWCGTKDLWELDIMDICEGFFEDKERWERGNVYPES